MLIEFQKTAYCTLAIQVQYLQVIFLINIYIEYRLIRHITIYRFIISLLLELSTRIVLMRIRQKEDQAVKPMRMKTETNINMQEVCKYIIPFQFCLRRDKNIFIEYTENNKQWHVTF